MSSTTDLIVSLSSESTALIAPPFISDIYRPLLSTIEMASSALIAPLRYSASYSPRLKPAHISALSPVFSTAFNMAIPVATMAICVYLVLFNSSFSLKIRSHASIPVTVFTLSKTALESASFS